MEDKKALYYEVGKDDEFITADDIKEAAVEAHEYCKRGFPFYGAEFNRR
jgi:hypothetical protein